MQPLIDQGRKVWLWPDKDGIDKWQEVADKLGSEQVQVYTRFFDTCWEPQDGDKADAADITIRIMHDPTFMPREQGATEPKIATASYHSGANPDPSPDKPEGVSNDDWYEHLEIMRAVGDYEVLHPELADAPFLDAEELTDPELHRRREILRMRYNFNKSKNEKDNKQISEDNTSAID
jgi:hypothetical protein